VEGDEEKRVRNYEEGGGGSLGNQRRKGRKDIDNKVP
jgi:hypothetical protein